MFQLLADDRLQAAPDQGQNDITYGNPLSQSWKNSPAEEVENTAESTQEVGEAAHADQRACQHFLYLLYLLYHRWCH